VAPHLLGHGEPRRHRRRAERLVAGRRDRLRDREQRSPGARRRPQAARKGRRARSARSRDRHGRRLSRAREPRARRGAADHADLRGRPGRHPLHEWDHGPSEGGSQYAPRYLRLRERRHGERGRGDDECSGGRRPAGRWRAAACDQRPGDGAALPPLRALRRGGDDAVRRRQDGLALRPFRSRRGAAPHRAGARHDLERARQHGLQGREPPGRLALRPVQRPEHRLRRQPHQSRGSGADPQGLSPRRAEHGPRLRALRVGHARGRDHRQGAPAVPRFGGASRRDPRDRDPGRRGSARAGRRGGGDLHPQPVSHAGVLAQSGGHRGDAAAWPLAAHGGRRPTRGGSTLHQLPRPRSDPARRREHLSHRDRAASRGPPERVGGCGGGRRPPGAGSGGQGLRGARGRRGGRTCAACVVGGQGAGALQGTGPLGGADGAAAAQRGRQGPQARRRTTSPATRATPSAARPRGDRCRA
jgi:hypothetical protein